MVVEDGICKGIAEEDLSAAFSLTEVAPYFLRIPA